MQVSDRLKQDSLALESVDFEFPVEVCFLLAAAHSNHAPGIEVRGLGKSFLANAVSIGGHDWSVRHTILDQVEGTTLTRKTAHYLPQNESGQMEWFIPFSSLATVTLTLIAKRL